MINRRTFVQSVALTAAGVLIALDRPWAESIKKNAQELLTGFTHPDDSSRPWVYWFWINGNLSREGITADLEAMQRVGIGGVIIMEVDPGTPIGDIPFGSGEWQEMFHFACKEAHRLGLSINMYNAAGWAGSGGPWITPELSMQKVTWSEAAFDGPKRVDQVFAAPPALKNYYREIAVLAFPTPGDDSYRIPEIRLKAGFEVRTTPYDTSYGLPIFSNSFQEIPSESQISPGQIKDISANFNDGKLSWDVPAGKWTVVRFGCTTTGVDNHPTPIAGRGLECDKLSKAAIDLHFSQFIGELVKKVGPLAGKTLTSTHIDSWESAGQNWTPQLREEFRKRCGYDMFPFLPVLGGRVVESLEVSERFLWDLRRVIGDLINENYAGRLRQLAHEKGLQLSIEGYDNDPCDEMSYAGQADEPQAEFWYGHDVYPEIYRSWSWCSNMVSAAHVYGRRIVAAEAFTSCPGENWQAHPASIKALGDWAFCAGINRFIFHRYAMQPWTNRKPGMTMGPWGLHYERTQTWWEESRDWHAYLTRCQYMLRQGLFVADLCYLQPEGAPMRFRPPGVDMRSAEPPDTPGYNFDGCTPEVVLMRMSIKDGRIVLPDGMSYRMLVLPEPGSMPGAGTITPQLLKKIVALVEQGMILVGSRPTRSPSLSSYPACDHQVEELANRLWGDCDGVRIKEHRLGKGRVIWGQSPKQVLAAMGIPEDFSTANGAFRYIHRRMDDGTEIYFVANKKDQLAEELCRFRVGRRRPELWWPETGQVEKPAMYELDAEQIMLPLVLPEHGSVFVIFPPESAVEEDRIVSAHVEGNSSAFIAESLRVSRVDNGAYECKVLSSADYVLKSANNKQMRIPVALPRPIAVKGPWKVHFAKGWGAPEQIELAKLISWSLHDHEGVRHFSGKAIYENTIEIPAAWLQPERRLLLDLGQVANIALLKWNGKDLGILWKPPFVIDITDTALSGRNAFEIAVVNTWVNRIIGDANLPEDCEWQPSSDGAEWGQRLAKWPAWFEEGKASPSGRYTFATWRFWSKDAPLLASGLLGPVTLRPAARIVTRLQ